jgi:hypothetical protein
LDLAYAIDHSSRRLSPSSDDSECEFHDKYNVNKKKVPRSFGQKRDEAWEKNVANRSLSMQGPTGSNESPASPSVGNITQTVTASMASREVPSPVRGHDDLNDPQKLFMSLGVPVAAGLSSRTLDSGELSTGSDESKASRVGEVPAANTVLKKGTRTKKVKKSSRKKKRSTEPAEPYRHYSKDTLASRKAERKQRQNAARKKIRDSNNEKWEANRVRIEGTPTPNDM